MKQLEQRKLKNIPKALGHHWLIELYGCPADLLKSATYIEKVMQEAALRSGATIVQSNFHQFSPFGVSGVVVIQESHLTIHTWPEYGYAAVDLFTCGDSLEPEKGNAYLKEVLQAKELEVQYIQRGFFPKFE
ncbi:MAG: adenosylmethionine decarboxylase [Saprospiraceae bacterium]|nr:adenosylmethionine decarboxylase [Saprospiraceae bacterium]